MDDLDSLWDNNSKYFLAPYDLLTPEIVAKAKWIWKEVITYTVNDISSYKSIRDLWVSMIMTDKIELLKNYNNKQNPLKHSVGSINLQKSSR